jgi:hypothetical protein
MDVDTLFGQPTVALRGPWNETDLVKIGPSAKDIVGRYEYHLESPLPLLNIVAGIVYALAMPFVALTTSYAYFDVRVRDELEWEQAPAIMPAEIALTN